MYFIAASTQFKKDYAASKPIYLRIIYSDVCLGNIPLTALCETGNIQSNVSTVLALTT